MPILAVETCVYPEDLLESCSPEAGDRWWRAIYTKARQEKALARQLLQYQIPFYLPLVPKDNYIRGRRVQSHIPLFAGYVFLFASEDERIQALTTNRISRILSIADQGRVLQNLKHVHRLIASGSALTVERRLSPGHRVRVKAGPLRGIEGTVLLRRGECRLLVAINFLQQGASVAIDDYMLDRLDGP